MMIFGRKATKSKPHCVEGSRSITPSELPCNANRNAWWLQMTDAVLYSDPRLSHLVQTPLQQGGVRTMQPTRKPDSEHAKC
jgi:hypothetical protein